MYLRRVEVDAISTWGPYPLPHDLYSVADTRVFQLRSLVRPEAPTLGVVVSSEIEADAL